MPNLRAMVEDGARDFDFWTVPIPNAADLYEQRQSFLLGFAKWAIEVSRGERTATKRLQANKEETQDSSNTRGTEKQRATYDGKTTPVLPSI